MSNRRGNKPADGISLFPFLAVLLCTMGGLLVLLVVLADAAKRRPVIVEAPPVVDEVDPAETSRRAALTRELARLEEALRKGREMARQANDELANQQARLTNSEQQHRKLERELSGLLVVVQRLEESEDHRAVDRHQAETELQRLQQLIDDTEEQVERLREKEHAPKSYAIVPYRGANGTFRRPIYVECTAEGVVIQPEGVKLTPDDFALAGRAGNPLAAAIRAAREQLNQDARKAGEEELPEAYPLLLVRPGGRDSYFAAVEAIKAFDGSFGYEFIDADWNVAYQPIDPVLAEVMNHAVYQSRQRMQALAAAAPKRFGVRLTGSGGAGAGAGVGGGGFGDGEHGVASGSNNQAAAGLDNGLFNDEVRTAQAMAGDATAAGGGSTTGSTAVNGESLLAADAHGTGQGEPARVGDLNGTSDAGGAGASAASGRYAPAGAETSQGGPGGASSDQTEANAPGGSAEDSSVAGATGGAASAAGAQAASSGGATGSGDPSQSGQSGMSAAGAAQQASAGANSVTVNWQSRPSTDAPAVQSLAAARGVDWALNLASQNSAPITRPVQAVMRFDSIDILPPRSVDPGAEAGVVEVRLDQPTNEAVDDLVAAVRRHIESWGLAGQGLHWRPVLVLSVAPGAEPNARKLAQLLSGSGIDVRLPQTAQNPAPEAPRATTRQ